MENTTFVIAGAMVLAIVFLMMMFAKLFRKAGPHEALIVYGFRGTRIVKGRGTVIFPMVENFRQLSLQLMSFDVAPQQDLYTKQGVAVTVEAVAQIKVKSDPESIQTAAEQFLTKSEQAEAQRDLEIKKAQYVELVKRQQAQADKAYDIQSNMMQQQVTTEAVKVRQVEKEQEIKVQEAEILRHEKELIANVLKNAEIERQRIEQLASAERQRQISEAEGRASAIRAQGEAEAEIIFKKGEAEAKAMNIKAEAFQEYNQAAVVDKLITGLPEVVRALSEPLSTVDKVTIVSTGDKGSAGASRLPGGS